MHLGTDNASCPRTFVYKYSLQLCNCAIVEYLCLMLIFKPIAGYTFYDRQPHHTVACNISTHHTKIPYVTNVKQLILDSFLASVMMVFVAEHER